MMRLKLPEIPVRVPQTKAPRIRKPAWYKATLEDKDNYTTLLDIKLKDAGVPRLCRCFLSMGNTHWGERPSCH